MLSSSILLFAVAAARNRALGAGYFVKACGIAKLGVAASEYSNRVIA
jgi:hypothetical protein